ncbi:MAG: 3-oxoacyl-ACP reductase FabG [Acidobacteriota bacterium]|nr:3-oxoacyl-ACP reductase FabG [Acidobacteriota bacterium]
MNMDGSVVLVSGGSRGIGRGIAEAFVEAGATVIVSATTAESATRVAAELGPETQVRGIGLNIADPASVEAAAGLIKEEYGKLSVLVNNAGITRDNLLLRMKEEEWDDVLQTNLGGVYRMCRAFAPSMIRAKAGRIINVTSVVGTTGNPGQTNYSAAKAGIEGFTRSLAKEIASRNVTVNCIAPGFIDTDMTRSLNEKTRDALLAQVPMKRLGLPSDIASAVVFLSGAGASYITGVTLHINGGMYM